MFTAYHSQLVPFRTVSPPLTPYSGVWNQLTCNYSMFPNSLPQSLEPKGWGGLNRLNQIQGLKFTIPNTHAPSSLSSPCLHWHLVSPWAFFPLQGRKISKSKPPWLKPYNPMKGLGDGGANPPGGSRCSSSRQAKGSLFKCHGGERIFPPFATGKLNQS